MRVHGIPPETDSAVACEQCEGNRQGRRGTGSGNRQGNRQGQPLN